MLPVSVHILTFNSAKSLPRALQSVKQCAEILVIDGGSTDNTVEIATQYGATVLSQRPEAEQGRPLRDFSSARNVGLQHATQVWILALDSDEYLSEELLKEITEIATSETEPAAYLVPRRYVLEDGSIVQYATTYPNERLYFFHRDAVARWMKPVHERPELIRDVKVKHLRGASLAPIGSAEDYKQKNLQYIQIAMEESRGKSWGYWFVHRLLHTLRSRLIALVKLLWIWLIPRRGKRLPLKQELIRFWYGWKLILATRPRR